MSKSMESIVSKLPTMDHTDLIKIKSIAEFLLNGKPQVQFSSSDERILFEAIKAELAVAGVNSNIAFSSITTGKYLKGWKRSTATVSSFLDGPFKADAKTEVQRLGLCRVFVQALIKEFKQRSIPISAGTIVLNLHRVQQVFDRAFPSYLESGLAYLIPKMMSRTSQTA